MEALHITAYLAGSIGLARSGDLALDGILASQMLKRHFGDEFFFLPDPKESLRFACLPLAMRGKPNARIVQLQTGDVWMEPTNGLRDESFWYWSCSSSQVQIQGRDTHYWNKRFASQAVLSDYVDFGGRVERIIIEQGRFKAYHMPLPTLVCDKMSWYAYGEASAIADLLLPVRGLGKKRAAGNGAVLRWEIDVLEEDYSDWYDNQLMRPLPGPLLLPSIEENKVVPHDIQYAAYRSPQWHPANQAMCVVRAVRHVA